MEYHEGNTIIVVISNTGPDRPENEFLERCCFNLADNNAWTYASTKGDEYKVNGLVDECNFVLYNQNNASNFNSFKMQINAINKRVLIYRHITGSQMPDAAHLKTIFSNCINCVSFSHSDENSKQIEEFMRGTGKITNIIEAYKKMFETVATHYLLHLFLPLDIDLQALEILVERKKKGEKVKDPAKYLKEMYADDIKYVDKLMALREKAEDLAEAGAIDKEKINRLISNRHVKKFFKKLDMRVTDSDVLLNHDWGIEKVESFHDWYCALAKCLRGIM